MATLRALCSHFIPGPPEDPDPGALEADVPAYIDLLLGAFEVEVPPIFAAARFGGPDRRDLYVVTADNTDDTALGGSIFRTRVEVPGVPVALARI